QQAALASDDVRLWDGRGVVGPRAVPRALEHRKTESELLRERPRLHAATQLPDVHPEHREAFLLELIVQSLQRGHLVATRWTPRRLQDTSIGREETRPAHERQQLLVVARLRGGDAERQDE